MDMGGQRNYTVNNIILLLIGSWIMRKKGGRGQGEGQKEGRLRNMHHVCQYSNHTEDIEQKLGLSGADQMINGASQQISVELRSLRYLQMIQRGRESKSYTEKAVNDIK